LTNVCGAYSDKDVFHSLENDAGVTVVLVHFVDVDDIVLEQIVHLNVSLFA